MAVLVRPDIPWHEVLGSEALMIQAERPGVLSRAVAGAGTVPVSCSAEAMLPMAVSQKWVAHACRMAGIAKPRWNRHTCVWTTSAIGESGAREAIVITAGSERSVAIKVEWLAPEGATAESATARRLVTAFFTGMQWAVRRR